jgi:hypothetical protein
MIGATVRVPPATARLTAGEETPGNEGDATDRLTTALTGATARLTARGTTTGAEGRAATGATPAGASA